MIGRLCCSGRCWLPGVRQPVGSELAIAPEPAAGPELAKLNLLRAHSLKTVVGRGRLSSRTKQLRPPGRASATPTGASPISKPIASRRTKLRECAPRKPRRTSSPSIATTCASHWAKAFEDRGEYAQSWQYYERGKRAQARGKSLPPGNHETNARKQMEVCTAQFFAARAVLAHRTPIPPPPPPPPHPLPIFIVGLPARDRRSWSRSSPPIRR